MFFLVLSYGINTILVQILISRRFPIHPSKGFLGILEIGYLNFRKYPSIDVLKKINAPEISAYFLAKHLGWSPF